MGNCSGKMCGRVGKDQKDEKKRDLYQAQDSFVRGKVETEEEADRASIDTDFDLNHDIVPLSYHNEDSDAKRDAWKNRLLSCGGEFDQIDDASTKVDIEKYQFPFENLIFEGGGNKGLAYCGAIKVLEQLGVMPQIKRYAGASAGAMTAALLAVGYNSDEIREFLSQDLSKIFLDHSCGYLSLLPNLLSGFGWNPGRRIFKWFGEYLARKTGNPDYTFYELYQQKGKELCIVVTNLNMMNAEYCHPKTTPNMPIRVAVRMSMAIPGLFQATNQEEYGQQNYYVDGGVLCNYPINCYDGWWLSMDMKDSFLNRLQPLEDFPKLFEKKERFGTFNEKSLGFLLYADNERDILKDILERRVGARPPEFPHTKLGKEKLKKKKMQERARLEHVRTLHAVNAFLKVLKIHNKNNDDVINREELSNALNDDTTFPSRYMERLFGKDISVKDAFDVMDENKDGMINFHELVRFIERTGISLQARFLGYQRKEIKGVFSFFDTLQSALLTNVKRIVVEGNDIKRTVGINTGHVGTSDFVLEEEDRAFVVEQGRRSTESFLRYYVVESNPPLKEKVQTNEDGTEEITIRTKAALDVNQVNTDLDDSAFPLIDDDKQQVGT
ncbi:hypothetical protein ACJMK2_023928 [Sinanodonta woodiana]|uniref:Calmodulin n=1 Tax=Sinanodonta woodiana TaxID=1069815 RepID=A0ABD3T6J7_SINWO